VNARHPSFERSTSPHRAGFFSRQRYSVGRWERDVFVVDTAGFNDKTGLDAMQHPHSEDLRVTECFRRREAGITEGPLFCSINRHGHVQAARLSPADVARVVKKLAERAGLDPVKYAGHSLRAGHATTAAASGASERSIMNQTGHRSVQMVRRYIREGSLFRENSAGKLGL
jgi:integrase